MEPSRARHDAPDIHDTCVPWRVVLTCAGDGAKQPGAMDEPESATSMTTPFANSSRSTVRADLPP